MSAWEYDNLTGSTIVSLQCDLLLNLLKADAKAEQEVFQDTRPSHRFIFEPVTPPGFDGFAGNYRGSNYPYLIRYEVLIGRYKGANSSAVAGQMAGFHSRLLEQSKRLFDCLAKHPVEHQIALVARFSALSIVKFLCIHPYANGNGHISRVLAWVCFRKIGIPDGAWSLHHRPKQPFDECIEKYRTGKKTALEDYLIQMLSNALNNPPVPLAPPMSH